MFFAKGVICRQCLTVILYTKMCLLSHNYPLATSMKPLICDRLAHSTRPLEADSKV